MTDATNPVSRSSADTALELQIERLLFNRIARNRLTGYTIETAHEIMGLIGAAQPSQPSADTAALAESLEQWVEAIRCPNNFHLTLTDIAVLNGECISDDIEKAAAALRGVAQQPAKAIRETAADAIRTFCQSLGAGTVVVSSDGVERIYYAGISLDALSVAIALALSSTQRELEDEVDGWKTPLSSPHGKTP